MSPLELAVLLAGAYLGVGLAFGAVFVSALVGRIDPDAEHGSWGFRLAILPGAVALWPWMVARLVRGGEPRERGPHLDAAREPAEKR
jgi:hypothetical protein